MGVQSRQVEQGSKTACDEVRVLGGKHCQITGLCSRKLLCDMRYPNCRGITTANHERNNTMA